MNITVEEKKSDGAERLLQVTIPVEEVDQARATVARRLARKVTIPGFRPGKAPANMVLKRFGDTIRSEVLDHLVQQAYKEVLDRENLQVASQPHVHDLKFDEGSPVSFELHLEIKPAINLARTSGFRIKRTELTVSDDKVEEQLNTLREQRASWIPLDEQPLEGDLVTLSLASAEEGEDMPDPRDYTIVIGGGQAIPGIEEVVLELKPGESTNRPVKWPDDFPDAAQAGKTKTVHVALKEAKRKSSPPLDDAFAREVGDFESLDALREGVRTDLLAEARQMSDAETRHKLLDEIIGANPFDVPPSWVRQIVDGYANVYSIPEEEKPRFATQFRQTAERQVRRDLVIETIADTEQLKATEADLDNKVTELAERRKTSPGQLYASLQKAGRLAELERGITEEKVFAWLSERNTLD
ncbi:MAG: trigger factor [Gemmatimonadota bacterium]